MNRRALQALEVVLVVALFAVQCVVLARADADASVDALAYVAVAAMILPVLLHRRAPVLAVILMSVGAAVWFLADYDVGVPATVVTAPAIGTLLTPPPWRGLVGLAALALVVTLVPPTDEREANPFIALALVPATVVFARDVRRRLLRSSTAARRADRIEVERRLARNAAITAAQARVARDVHDIVAHSMSVIAARAAIGRQLAPTDPAFGRATLDLLGDLTSQSLQELDALVAALRAPGGGAEDGDALVVGIDQVEHLVTATRDAGHPVELAVEGELASLPASLSMSAYRIVQEALTNVRRHAPGAPVRVRIVRGPTTLRVRVANGAATVQRTFSDSSGFGLTGVRERVELFGGTVDAGPADGGFVVDVSLPVASSG